MAFQSKFLHVRIRVHDLDRSIQFYTEVFGFKEIRRSVSPAGNNLAFIELPGNETVIELCYNQKFGDFTRAFGSDAFLVHLLRVTS